MRRSLLAFLFHASILAYSAALIILPIRHRLAIAPPGTVYTFQHRILEDYYFYLAVIRQGRDGLLEYDQYTTEPTQPTTMHFLYLLLGQIGKYTKASDITLYYAGMITGFLAMYLFSWKLATLLLPSFYRYIAMGIFFLASPFPVMTVTVAGITVPIGTSWWTNMDPYSRLTQVPHHYLGQALLVGTSYMFLRFITLKKLPISLAISGFLAAGIFVYSVPLIVFLIAICSVVTMMFLQAFVPSKRQLTDVKNILKKHEKILLGSLIIIGISGLCLLLVQQILASPGWPWSTFLTWEANWYNHKTEIYPYTIGVYLISFGVLPVFLIPATIRIIRKPSFAWVFIVCAVVVPLVLYLAAANHLLFLPKIRFIHSAPYVFAGLLAVLGIQTLLTFIRIRPIKMIAALLIVGLFAANWYYGLKSYWLP